MLHLGGGALSIPRYIGATRPGSRQHVVELYEELYEFVVEHLPLPDDTVTAEFTDARAALEGAGRYQVAIVDVFSGDVAPRHISTVQFFETLAGHLEPGGLVLVNTLATRGLEFTREVLVTLGEVFEHTVAVANPKVIAGELVGNVELAASMSRSTRTASGPGCKCSRAGSTCSKGRTSRNWLPAPSCAMTEPLWAAACR